MENKQFLNRIGFGVWINDFRREPIIGEDWPSVRIDNTTVEDFKKMILALRGFGYNYFDIFGLLTNSDWPLDIKSVVDSTRKDIVKELIEFSHANDIKIIYGLGVYSWGFDTIINSDKHVRGTNPHALCGSSPESKQWMEDIIEYIEENFTIDGYHLEVADQGRCECEKCRAETNLQYYNRLNKETAAYIRSKWPERFILVNTSGYLPWGDFVNESEFTFIEELGEVIDVFIDGGNHGYFIREQDRKKLLEKNTCDYGTSGAFWIYPPQRWERDRWFLPYAKKNIKHLKKLYDDGSRSCELYLGPLNNVSTEFNIVCNGLFLQNVERDIQSIFGEAVEILFKPKSEKRIRELSSIFEEAENVFFDNWSPHRITDIEPDYSDGIEPIFKWSSNYGERAVPGELFLEPLLGSKTGIPAYLAVHMNAAGRKKYKQGILDIKKRITMLENEVPRREKITNIVSSIDNVVNDIDFIEHHL